MKKSLPFLLIPIFSLINFLAVYGAERQIEPGNLVNITVLGSPELSRSVVVFQDGTTDYPLLAGIPVDGLTVKQLREVLQPILARLVERPKLFISLAEFTQLEVLVEGQINKPGTFIVKGPINLQGVLSITGGTTQQADLRNITINRQGHESRRVIVVDLYAFFFDPDNNPIPELKNGDIIFVPIMTPASSIGIMGAVRAPGTYPPEKGKTIASMINLAGGPLPNGDMSHVIYITSIDGHVVSKVVNVRRLTNKGMMDQIPQVHAGDVIVVAEYRWWQSSSFWVQTLRDVTLVLTSLVILSRL